MRIGQIGERSAIVRPATWTLNKTMLTSASSSTLLGWSSGPRNGMKTWDPRRVFDSVTVDSEKMEILLHEPKHSYHLPHESGDTMASTASASRRLSSRYYG